MWLAMISDTRARLNKALTDKDNTEHVYPCPMLLACCEDDLTSFYNLKG